MRRFERLRFCWLDNRLRELYTVYPVSFIMEALQTQITGELEQIRLAVEQMTGLPSRWSGTLELVPDADFKGKKPFRCDVLIHADLAGQPYRWTTLIHEMLHSVSAGYARDDYQDLQGWEEGVVEQIQRFLRPRILVQLRVSVEEETADAFRQIEEGHAYNDFIAAIERLRVLVSDGTPRPSICVYWQRPSKIGPRCFLAWPNRCKATRGGNLYSPFLLPTPFCERAERKET